MLLPGMKWKLWYSLDSLELAEKFRYQSKKGEKYRNHDSKDKKSNTIIPKIEKNIVLYLCIPSFGFLNKNV